MKPKKCHFFQHSIVFVGYVLSADGISANPKKVDKVNSKELQSFLGLALYYHQSMPKFATTAKCLHQIVGPANHQKSKKSKKNEPMAT